MEADWSRAPLRWFTLIGRNGPPCFTLGTMISLGGDVINLNTHVPGLSYGVDAAAVLLMVFIAWVTEELDRRKKARAAALAPQTAPVPENAAVLARAKGDALHLLICTGLSRQVPGSHRTALPPAGPEAPVSAALSFFLLNIAPPGFMALLDMAISPDSRL
ncbi:MAG: OpgC domain-containing protein [Parvibaculaceae bacterium]|nr:OpgC domain-containing protein [Parvibaculaceae bacterium]